jgi:hypothetical protein
MIERLFHEPLERDGAALANCVADEIDQDEIAGVHRVVKKLKRLHG